MAYLNLFFILTHENCAIQVMVFWVVMPQHRRPQSEFLIL